MRVETSGSLYRFAGALESLLAAPHAAAFEQAWETAHVDRLAWEALGDARRPDSEALEPALDQVDRRLLATLQRCRAFADPHVVTFRVPELERWQHAAAAALVGARWGIAGLRTVIADTGAPLGRRYFAFLALAERHPEGAWPLFERYLVTPGAHHAFVAAATPTSSRACSSGSAATSCCAASSDPRSSSPSTSWARKPAYRCSRSCSLPGTPTRTWIAAK